MAASSTDLLKKYKSLFSTTLSVGIGTGTSDTLTPSTVTGLPTTTGITLTIDRVDSSAVATPSNLERITGVISGGNLTSYVRAKDGTTEQAHSAGAVIEMVWNAQDWNDMIDWGLSEHNQLGTHKTGFMVASYFSASSINSSAINASAVTAGRLGASAVVVGNLGASAVTSGNIGASAIVLGNLGASSVSSGNLNFTPEGSTDGWTAAGETWTYASADDPTFTFTVAGVDLTTKYHAGMRIKLTQTTAKYFIITKVAFSTDTTITIYGGTDYDLANAAITSPYHSKDKAPTGFPLDPLKWTAEFADTASRSQASPVTNTWYNVGTSLLAIPIGAWRVNYQCVAFSYQTTVTTINLQTTLSTANNSSSDADLNGYVANGGASGTVAVYGTLNREKYLLLASKTTYYLNIRATVSAATVDFKGDLGTTLIRATCAYL